MRLIFRNHLTPFKAFSSFEFTILDISNKKKENMFAYFQDCLHYFSFHLRDKF